MSKLKPVPANKQKSLGKLPTDVRNKMGYAKKGKMIHKKGLGGLLSGLAKKVFGKKSDTAMPSTPVQVAFENGKIPIAKLYKQVAQKTTGAKYGKMMKAKKGVMAKSSTSKMEEDKYSKYVRSIKLPEPGDIFKEMKTPYLKPKGKSMGGEMKSTQGYGAARTSGMGLQDEDLIPGKSMDYYKDLM